MTNLMDGNQMAALKKSKKKCPIMDAPEPFSVWVSWKYTSVTGGEICEGQEDVCYPDREHAVNGVFTEDKCDTGWDNYSDRIEVPFKPIPGHEVFVVGVVYSDGDTFGSSSGHFTVVGVYEHEHEAEAAATEIRAEDEARYNSGNRTGKLTDYREWTGYFNCLEGVEVHKFQLDEQSYGVRQF